MPERNRFLRGMTVWIGFTQTAVPFVRQERHAGVTKYPLRKMLRFSFDAITSFSERPLQWATFLGFFFSRRRVPRDPADDRRPLREHLRARRPTTIIVVLLLGGIQLITLGIIGEYVGRIYDEVKHRPLYVVGERINFEEPENDEDRRCLGAGVAGLVAGLRLTEAGHTVDVYERWPGLGGQAGDARRRPGPPARALLPPPLLRPIATSRRSTTSSGWRTSSSGVRRASPTSRTAASGRS
jgi:hypothetical protein